MYPPVGFHFRISFEDLQSPVEDSGFHSISGLEVQVDLDINHKNNQQTKELVATVIYAPLVLKRAVRDKKKSALTAWFFDCVRDKKIIPISEVRIELLGEDDSPVLYWKVHDVIPKSWKLDELNADASAVLMETIELNYSNLSFGPDLDSNHDFKNEDASLGLSTSTKV